MNINVEKCLGYLRSIGIELSEEQGMAWGATEREFRATRRASNRELKKSCGHFRTYWTKIYHSGGLTEARACSACNRYVEYRGASC